MKDNIFLKGEVGCPVALDDYEIYFNNHDGECNTNCEYSIVRVSAYDQYTVECELTCADCNDDFCPLVAKYVVKEKNENE